MSSEFSIQTWTVARFYKQTDKNCHCLDKRVKQKKQKIECVLTCLKTKLDNLFELKMK